MISQLNGDYVFLIDRFLSYTNELTFIQPLEIYPRKNEKKEDKKKKVKVMERADWEIRESVEPFDGYTLGNKDIES